MYPLKKILVATDTRFTDHPVLAAAATVAEKNNAAMTIVDGVPEFPSSVRRSLDDHAHIRELLIQEKQEQLDQLANSIRDRVQVVHTKVLSGKTSVEIIRETQRGQYDLVARVAKGTNSKQQGFFGATGFQLLLNCPAPLWLVSPTNTGSFENIAGCVDTSSSEPVDEDLNENIVAVTTAFADHFQSKHTFVHAWTVWNEQMLKSRMGAKLFSDWQEQVLAGEKKALDGFLEKHNISVDANHAKLIHGDPHLVVPDYVEQNDVDLLVLGSVGRSGIYGMIMGNTAERILRRITCSVLAIKPQDFISPVKFPNATNQETAD